MEVLLKFDLIFFIPLVALGRMAVQPLVLLLTDFKGSVVAIVRKIEAALWGICVSCETPHKVAEITGVLIVALLRHEHCLRAVSLFQPLEGG